MKRAACLASAVLGLSFLAVRTATAQVPYNQGPGARVVLVHILPGHFDRFMADLKKNIVPLRESEKAAGSSPKIRCFSTKPRLAWKTGLRLFANLQEHGRANLDGLPGF
jgi:hypothetical protein